MKLNYIDFKPWVDTKGKIKGLEMSGFDVWENYTKKECLKIIWFIITKILFRL